MSLSVFSSIGYGDRILFHFYYENCPSAAVCVDLAENREDQSSFPAHSGVPADGSSESFPGSGSFPKTPYAHPSGFIQTSSCSTSWGRSMTCAAKGRNNPRRIHSLAHAADTPWLVRHVRSRHRGDTRVESLTMAVNAPGYTAVSDGRRSGGGAIRRSDRSVVARCLALAFVPAVWAVCVSGDSSLLEECRYC